MSPWLILEAGFKKAATKPQIPKKLKKPQKGGSPLITKRLIKALAVVVVFFLSFFPNISRVIASAQATYYTPSEAWCESLSWMKENTPEPFGKPDFYYELYESPPQGKDYDYPESAYSIMAWWDYGHWITRIAHRIPICNPFQQGASEAARFFTAQNEESAGEIIDNVNSKYIVVDYETANIKFYAMPAWAGSNEEEFYDVYYQMQDDKLVPILLFHAEYYRSLAIRLYNFDGVEVTPQNSWVICYQERLSREGPRIKVITSTKLFSNYEEAEAYVSSQESDNYKIVSNNPFISPVPLDELEHYKLLYSSDSLVTQPGNGMIPAVKIFEYVK
jgi:asparagine N-glycosylation enzyme membrane subunit Stt3